MIRKQLLTYAMLIAVCAIMWAANGFPRLDPARLGLAGLALLVFGFLISLKWDVAKARQTEALLKKHDNLIP